MIGIRRTVIDGEVVGPGFVMSATYGHFTAMQVRNRRVRGLGPHLARLEAASRELFGAAPDAELILGSIRTLLGEDIRDASVRVYVLAEDRVRVVAMAGPPVDVSGTPQSVRTVVYQRFLPHIKHVGGFPQVYLRQQAAGFDEALLTTEDGLISEGAITNLGCIGGGRVVWPDAPMLRGITMRLIQETLEREGVPQEHRPLRAADLTGYDTVFLTNSRGITQVGSVDGLPLDAQAAPMRWLLDRYEAIPWDEV
ncbi:hypothetical protein Misp01_82290 [Microtetraspora sp. NBRC 13810]|uniref:aminotransferase class IV n=1 Tax=Microtetraspora sp. NBRC 13810 TaxID=3030990 RepID=UPI0024A58C17|nr:aminotransferase class IV [Microtetraspora sp. NBRC 13810]GLW13101.1 hypothetical protein Misp01_82290 [Microtetraspora sp. NBRC 13810]